MLFFTQKFDKSRYDDSDKYHFIGAYKFYPYNNSLTKAINVTITEYSREGETVLCMEVETVPTTLFNPRNPLFNKTLLEISLITRGTDIFLNTTYSNGLREEQKSPYTLGAIKVTPPELTLTSIEDLRLFLTFFHLHQLYQKRTYENGDI